MIYENNLFNPTNLDLSRSTFHMTPTSSGTCNAGRLLPIRTFWVQPGDSMKMNVKSLIKMSTPVYPTMDALFAQVDFFFVPFRLLLSRRYGSPSVLDSSESWEAIIGAQDFLLNMPTPASGVKMPVLRIGAGSNSARPGYLMDYFPVYFQVGNDYKLNALPLLAYWSIWNENYRDPNLMTPVTWSFATNSGTGDVYVVPSGMVPLYATKMELNKRGAVAGDPDYSLVNALGSGKAWNPASPDTTYQCESWLPFPVCRFHGFFGSCLPWPQRNTTGVTLPLGTSAPVIGSDTLHSLKNAYIFGTLNNVPQGTYFAGFTQPSTTPKRALQGLVNSGDDSQYFLSPQQINYTSLIADLSEATAANVNALRASIQLQRWYEKLARSGNRYDELEYGTFGVRPHDSGDNRPLFLGGKRINLNIQMVASTNGDTSASSGEGAGSLGALGAFSHTNDEDGYFYHSFDDWGVVMCMVSIRHHDTFGTGTDPFWLKRTRDDLYFPTFAHLGEQVEGDHLLIDKADDGTVFGYQPAWTEYRNEIDRVHGLLRPGQNLQFMTYARNFGTGTTLAEFLNASSQVSTVDQTLAVSSVASGFQFVYQFTFDVSWRRCMPTDSIPGLMDHF